MTLQFHLDITIYRETWSNALNVVLSTFHESSGIGPSGGMEHSRVWVTETVSGPGDLRLIIDRVFTIAVFNRANNTLDT